MLEFLLLDGSGTARPEGGRCTVSRLPGDIPFLGMLIALAARKPLIEHCGSWAANARTTFGDGLVSRC